MESSMISKLPREKLLGQHRECFKLINIIKIKNTFILMYESIFCYIYINVKYNYK